MWCVSVPRVIVLYSEKLLIHSYDKSWEESNVKGQQQDTYHFIYITVHIQKGTHQLWHFGYQSVEEALDAG